MWLVHVACGARRTDVQQEVIPEDDRLLLVQWLAAFNCFRQDADKLASRYESVTVCVEQLEGSKYILGLNMETTQPSTRRHCCCNVSSQPMPAPPSQMELGHRRALLNAHCESEA